MRFLLIVILLFSNSSLIAQKFFTDEINHMPVGAYYYPEHWKPEHWKRDLGKIAELGFSFTHFGEFAWSRMEPEEGKFDFRWLDECIDIAAKNGLKVILCTPTPTPPAWLTEKHPEILIKNDQDLVQQHGSRLHASYNNPVYLHYVEKIVTQLADRYGKNPNVWGWQIDNEPHFGTLYDYSDYAETEFRQWLRKKYLSIDQLNHAWGNAFWSQEYNHFDQIRLPNPKKAPQGVNPHAMLDFQRFTADQLAAAIRFQAVLLRNKINQEQWITTNYAYYKFLPVVDLFRNQNDLDFASHTMYLLSTALNYPAGNQAHRLGSGLELSFSQEFANSINGYTGIMELQPGQINWGKYNSQPLPGAVRMWIWHSFGLGDKFTCTYRFRQPIFGSEQFHKGIMEPDGITVSPGGKEYIQALTEIKGLPKLINPQMPAEVASRKTAILWDQDNLFDMMNYPHNEKWDSWQHIYTHYENLKTLGAPVTFLEDETKLDPKEYPFVLVPAFQLIDRNVVEKWNDYVSRGGNLIITSRTGMKDKNGHLWEALLQEPIRDLIGAEILYYDHLPPEKNGEVSFEGKSYNWNIWGDILDVRKNVNQGQPAKILATYANEFYQGKPAVISRTIGKGTVTYLGVWTIDGELERNILRRVYSENNAEILDLPRYVFQEWRNGYFVTVNYTSEPVKLTIPEGTRLVVGEDTLQPAGVSVWTIK
jgi:beta-galactosidase